MIQLLLSTGLPPADIHRVLDDLPKSRRETYRRCRSLSDAAFGLDAEADDE